MSTIAHPGLDNFLLGYIAACSLVAALFFLRFWRDTRDPLFLAFTLFFLIQGFISGYLLRIHHPNLGRSWVFAMRLLSVLIVLASILKKNFSSN